MVVDSTKFPLKKQGPGVFSKIQRAAFSNSLNVHFKFSRVAKSFFLHMGSQYF